MTDHDHPTHTHDGDPHTYVDPNALGYNPIQLMSLSHINAIVYGVYQVGVNPDDHSDIRIIDFNAGTMVEGHLTADGDIIAFGQTMPAVVWAFSCIQHPQLKDGEGHTVFHAAFQDIIGSWSEQEGSTIADLISMGRTLARALDLIPAGVGELSDLTN